MNYLDMCRRVVTEAGIAGGGHSNVENQSGQLLKVTGWVKQAWMDIQLMRPNWLFMNKEFAFDTDAAVRDYMAADKSINDMKLWDTGSFLIYDKSIGESDQNELVFYPYAKWRSQYRNRMNDRPDDRPQLFTIMPDNKFVLSLSPIKYTQLTVSTNVARRNLL